MSEFFNVEVVEEFFNVKVVEDFFRIEVVNEFFNSEVMTTVDRSNIEVVDEFFNVKVVDEVFVFAAIRLLLRGCRAPPHSSRLQGSRSVFYIFLYLHILISIMCRILRGNIYA